MKTNLRTAISYLVLVLAILSSTSYSSDMRDSDERPSCFKKTVIFALLASSGLASAQELPYLSPYKELNMSSYIRTNYEGDMPVGPRATIKYSYTIFAPGNPGYNDGLHAIYDTYCLMQQAKIERALEIRQLCNAMYKEVQGPDIPDTEKYAMLASIISIETSSHMLEMEAAKFAASVPVNAPNSNRCAIPTPMK